MNKRLTEMIKFVFTGGVCFLIEYAALTAMVEWAGMDVLIATPLAFLISVIANYLLCVKWVFEGAKEGSRKAQLGFVVTSLMGLAINWLAMLVLTRLFGREAAVLTVFGMTIKVYQVNKAIATLIVMVWNYFTKRLVLKGTSN